MIRNSPANSIDEICDLINSRATLSREEYELILDNIRESFPSIFQG